MPKLIITSIHKDAGKTSFIVGLGRLLDRKIGFMKPFGDRLLYRKKRLWDYDAALMTGIFNIDDLPEDMSIGFDHSKLRYMYDESGAREKVNDMVSKTAAGKDILFIESGSGLAHGISVHLDALTVAKNTGARLIVLLSGDNDQILDDASFLKKYINLNDINFGGVVINKVKDTEEFATNYLGYFTELGIEVLGVLPYRSELTYPSIKFIADVLFAKILSGEQGIDSIVKNIFVGAMGADAVLRVQKFKKENKLIITSGDRSDMILAALDTHSKGIVLTNNILPPANLIARASDEKIPLLMVASDTYQTAKKIDDIVPLITAKETGKIELLAELVRQNVKIDNLII
ncbi:MAG: DRTGG domain-containing protein [Candidatus Neomarinimicrobiota bacterium]